MHKEINDFHKKEQETMKPKQIQIKQHRKRQTEIQKLSTQLLR